MWRNSSSMTASGVARVARFAAICRAALAGRVTAGAKGISTGSSVGSLTRSATCGRQGSVVAYHWLARWWTARRLGGLVGLAGVAVGGRGNVRVSDARLVDGCWVGLGLRRGHWPAATAAERSPWCRLRTPRRNGNPTSSGTPYKAVAARPSTSRRRATSVMRLATRWRTSWEWPADHAGWRVAFIQRRPTACDHDCTARHRRRPRRSLSAANLESSSRRAFSWRRMRQPSCLRSWMRCSRNSAQNTGRSPMMERRFRFGAVAEPGYTRARC